MLLLAALPVSLTVFVKHSPSLIVDSGQWHNIKTTIVIKNGNILLLQIKHVSYRNIVTIGSCKCYVTNCKVIQTDKGES